MLGVGERDAWPFNWQRLYRARQIVQSVPARAVARSAGEDRGCPRDKVL